MSIKILMATMQLDIGGAETHIVELSKALARKGVEVVVASNGGAYVKELEDAGIRHFAVELNRKNPIALYHGYQKLKRIIAENNIDVVHAHARIPAFLCGILHRRMNFRFVTTAHWVFSTVFPFRLLTNWGERSLAVSDDIKQYLIENYGCTPENIRVTINGVDTDKFSEGIDVSDIKEEFGLGDGKTRIVYVSRMDTDRSLAAHKLIEAAPVLFERIPNVEIVVVGGGNDFEPIKAEAEAVNARLGSRVVIVTGARTDINKFTAAADVFVGVSRAALEAMACKKPAIIAGNEGYIGIFDEDKLGVSIDTNFCCRGCGETTTEQLCGDLLKLLEGDKAELRKKLGEYSLLTVKRHYSVDTMAEDALKMYISVVKNTLINETDVSELNGLDEFLVGHETRPSDFVISGYYGFNNSGDDSILSAIIEELKSSCPDASITVMSKNPAETSRLYGVKSFGRLNIFKMWKIFGKTKLLISGGGSLIQDVTSSKSLYYYLMVIYLAKKRGAKVMLYANGIGPITKQKNIKFVKAALKCVDYITLREKSSLEKIGDIVDKKVPCEITADPVFASNIKDDSVIDKLLQNSGIGGNDKFFVVTVRDWQSLDMMFAQKICAFIEYVWDTYNIKPLIIPMQWSFDKEISEKIFKGLAVPGCIAVEAYTPDVMMGIVARAEFVLGMRLHALIYAVKAGIPAIALDYDPKVAAVMNEIDLDYTQDVSNIDVKGLCRFADEIVEKRQAISEELCKKSIAFTRLAKRNTEIAVELIKE